ncbi:endonuclease/exonuclease/phosphatase family protein [Dactylosporangium sp. AC04546]|uniref:endonuclease/exonuclease/phosphatase family protein n=1 Tax=Dactylosporangium sp. AC04546 TaxID=2862460 RepID=UPI001EDCDAAE|nr:endonuclease/exonuclease/phosphatase family protein [Dactylosporangium sp. AC04546]WVK82200.1 endonuclease/exonuclease/phosphatase family protein [Dactylosporangium sp. AC04546]
MTKLRVLSYNVHSLKDDRRSLAAVVREVAPDVAILQEAPRRFRWRQKSADLARDFELVVGGGGLPALGNLILTNLRVRAVESWDIRYPLTPGRHMRGAAFVRCRVGRSTFVAVGSHLSTDATERPSQAELLKQHMNEVPEPLLFGGDLNENSGGAAWRMIADGLTDAAGADERHTFPCGGPRERLDAVFADPRMTVLQYDVVDTPEARAASDHFPVVVDLEFD